MDIQQIANLTNFTVEELIETHKLFATLPEYLATPENLPGTHYDRYLYLWQNLTFRYGSNHQKYQL